MKKSIEFDKIIDRITDAFYIIDADGILTYASASVSKILGHSPDDLISRSALEFIHPDEHHFAYENQEKLLAYPGSRLVHDYRILNADNSYQWMEFTFVNMINIPQVGGIMTQMRDVSERKTIELMLEESRQRFSLFMDKIPATVWIRDHEDKYVYVNETFERLSGKSSGDLLGKTYWEVFPEEAESISGTDRLCIDYGKEIEYLDRGPDDRGIIKDWVVYKFPMPQPNGNTFIGSLGFDISRITHAKDLVDEAEDKFKQIFDNAPDAIFIEDEFGIILDANTKACELQGLDLEALKGMNILDLTPEHKQSFVATEFKKLWNMESNSLTSFTWAVNGNEIPVEIHSARTKHAGKDALVLTLRKALRVV